MHTTLFDFTKTSDISDWKVINDGVMGGVSEGSFSLNDDGHGIFEGIVRLENNGGFSSIRYEIGNTAIGEHKTVSIRLKGDGKTYQFRLKQHANDEHSYITEFNTTGYWETIEIPLKSLYPSFRGRTLNLGYFSGDQLEEIGFLIGNKKKESFTLLIDSITLQ